MENKDGGGGGDVCVLGAVNAGQLFFTDGIPGTTCSRLTLERDPAGHAKGRRNKNGEEIVVISRQKKKCMRGK